MLNIKHFLESKDLDFDNNKQAVTWVKCNLAPDTLLKIGPNYMVDEKEMEQLYSDYRNKFNSKNNVKQNQ